MSTEQRRTAARRSAARALPPARVRLILEVEYRRAQRDIHRRTHADSK